MNFKNIFLIMATIILSFSLSAEASAFDKTLSSVYILVRVFGALLAIILAFLGVKKLYDFANDNRGDPKNRPAVAIIMLFASALLLDMDKSMSLMINTVTGSGGYCFYGESVNSNSNPFGNDSSCFDNAMSVTEDLAKEMQNETGAEESIKKLKEKLRMLFMLFQIVGVVYFMKGVYMLKGAAEGAQDVTYGKILLILFASSAVIDMPHTIDIIVNTISSWNDTI